MKIPREQIDQAIELARAATRANPKQQATWEPVHRLDSDRDDYLLVSLGLPGKAGWVAAVSLGEEMEVMVWAENKDGGPTISAGAPNTELVWTPKMGRSPIFPERRVRQESDS